jgi:hypothetical protein
VPGYLRIYMAGSVAKFQASGCGCMFLNRRARYSAIPQDTLFLTCSSLGSVTVGTSGLHFRQWRLIQAYPLPCPITISYHILQDDLPSPVVRFSLAGNH